MMSKGLLDTKRLDEEFQKFISSQFHSRFVKETRYGEQLTNTSHAEKTLSIASKVRKLKRDEDPYPIIKEEVKKV